MQDRARKTKERERRAPLWGAFAGAFFAGLDLHERAGARNMTYERAEPSSNDKTPSAHDMRPNGVAKRMKGKKTQKITQVTKNKKNTFSLRPLGRGTMLRSGSKCDSLTGERRCLFRALRAETKSEIAPTCLPSMLCHMRCHIVTKDLPSMSVTSKPQRDTDRQVQRSPSLPANRCW